MHPVPEGSAAAHEGAGGGVVLLTRVPEVGGWGREVPTRDPPAPGAEAALGLTPSSAASGRAPL